MSARHGSTQVPTEDPDDLEALQTDNLHFEKDAKGKSEDILADGWPMYIGRSLRAMLFTSRLNVLLPCVVLAMISANSGGGESAKASPAGWTFTFALLGIAPLAERLGFVTEEMAGYTNQTLGGLLNATFGNLTEMIVSVFALKAGMIRVVQLSLLGSMLSNMLLVLGCAFFFGGLKYREQKFNPVGVNANTGLLCLAVVGMSLPAVLHSTHSELHGTSSEIALSRFTSLMLLGIYGAYLYFQLVTHRELFEEEEEDDADDEDEEESAGLGFWGCIFWLGVLTVFISILSDYLVDAIEGAAASWDMSMAFISTVLLPIVGNAAEHASAVIFGMRNKMDMSIGVAVGSSTQIALLVFPATVLIGWAMGKPMDLDLEVFETATLFITVVIVAFVVSDGSSNWLKGLTLILAYVVLSCSFFFHRDSELAQQWPGSHAK
mmetsp:Transcript_50152/g.95806  ORF Transcript_50152/g.95806 Transcript_50152/m.95806 type:complete len:435 (-) Transcript_50152:311-1615(-)|eukprot:CAMPEP_0114248542 /NCGR_PEP_ID=MMETSP0058-20121206/13629_1 /TAXON_ID=36894 /ORGANISM="Pyramimonas parkeae, CCMP726" /LENGTH=434 /DNA_ID=CAMNT_0001361957 /DNA_START=174 /DNA_END=1478 /DNA_ORIENTATION=+